MNDTALDHLISPPSNPHNNPHFIYNISNIPNNPYDPDTESASKSRAILLGHNVLENAVVYYFKQKRKAADAFFKASHLNKLLDINRKITLYQQHNAEGSLGGTKCTSQQAVAANATVLPMQNNKRRWLHNLEYSVIKVMYRSRNDNQRSFVGRLIPMGNGWVVQGTKGKKPVKHLDPVWITLMEFNTDSMRVTVTTDDPDITYHNEMLTDKLARIYRDRK
ncbi:MAG: hypothetical protein DRI46_09580 [Chloroflexi bacterium]|nr:MAG: hypothetical protein DRI46_09580 [Chloroflexota bacterium]